MLRQREDMEARLAKIRAKEKAQREQYLKGEQPFKRRKTEADKKDENDEEQFVLDDYDSDREQSNLKKGADTTGFSAATLELMGKLGMGTSAPDEEEEVEDEVKVNKITLVQGNRSDKFRSSSVLERILNSHNSSTNSVE
jgi:chromosome transmission fidelity protein 1